MAALTSAPLSVALLSVGLLLSVSAEQRIITAELGQDVTLTCGAPNNNITIIVVEWNRTDLEPGYVLIYRDGQLYLDDQDPSFKNRVDLQDRQMKDGNVSLILKDVTTDDGGTYKCRVIQRRRHQERRELKTISIIKLEVVPPGKKEGRREGGGEKDGGEKDGGEKGGSVGLIVGLIVGLSVLSLVGFLIYKRKPACLNLYQPPAEPAAEPQQI